MTSSAPGGSGGVASPASSGTPEKGAIAKWFSSASNIALLVILVIAIVLFILVMSGSLT